jgi:hypothetical protein
MRSERRPLIRVLQWRITKAEGSKLSVKISRELWIYGGPLLSEGVSHCFDFQPFDAYVLILHRTSSKYSLWRTSVIQIDTFTYFVLRPRPCSFYQAQTCCLLEAKESLLMPTSSCTQRNLEAVARRVVSHKHVEEKIK